MTTQTIRISRRGLVRAAPRDAARSVRPADDARRAGSSRIRTFDVSRCVAHATRDAARLRRVCGACRIDFGDRANGIRFPLRVPQPSAAIPRSLHRGTKRPCVIAAAAPRLTAHATNLDTARATRARRVIHAATAARPAVTV
ncbi:hypothetical protein [Burkholderia mayonis]|uniref:Uncharacterized protein n=1 Tax=Burkholderia mayonis TaxID=1385591 RepID=A0A1B4FZZ2_9BURK|nr:hypothetical protein [Burkholderia mayonis]AOJ09227.1 hypothetical protein WS71_17815 [Burkholderia mayonis]